MRKRNTALISLLLLCALAGGAIWITSNSAAHGNAAAGKRGEAQLSPVAADTSNPLININAKSRAANQGGETEIRGLADEIFTSYQFDEAPAGISEDIKERLVRAEISYRAGNGQQGVSDASIVRAVNYLGNKVGAPDYAQTNVFELRRMKSGILPYTADLQARSHKAQANAMIRGDRSARANDPTTPTMSPLEATFFMTALVQQKQFNSEYQLTNKEYVQLHGGKRRGNSNKQFRAAMESRKGDSSRTDELEKKVKKHATAMTLSEIVNLPQELMYVLGIDK